MPEAEPIRATIDLIRVIRVICGLMFELFTLLAAIGSAVIAGVLFVFSVCIMRALGALPPAQGIAAMQMINVTILNPWFLSIFVGTATACAIVLGLTIARGELATSIGAVAGSLLYVVGVLGTTRTFNIPRNDALARVAPDSAEAVTLWRDYLKTWTWWNHVRTAAGIAAAVAFAAPCWFR